MEAFQQSIPRYVNQIGWTVKKAIAGQNSFILELKKGIFDKAVIKARGNPDDVYVEVEGPQDLMDIAEQALAESCSNPGAIVGWKEQARDQAMEFAKGFAGVIQTGVPSGAVPPPPTPAVAPKPAAPKLRETSWPQSHPGS